MKEKGADMETCIRACIAKDLNRHRVQINAGDLIKPYRNYTGVWKVILFGKGVVTITNEQLVNNFGTPILKEESKVQVDNAPPIGLVDVYV